MWKACSFAVWFFFIRRQSLYFVDTFHAFFVASKPFLSIPFCCTEYTLVHSSLCRHLVFLSHLLHLLFPTSDSLFILNKVPVRSNTQQTSVAPNCMDLTAMSELTGFRTKFETLYHGIIYLHV